MRKRELEDQLTPILPVSPARPDRVQDTGRFKNGDSGTLVYRYTVYRWLGQTKPDLVTMSPSTLMPQEPPVVDQKRGHPRWILRSRHTKNKVRIRLESVPYTGVLSRTSPKAAGWAD